MLVPVFYYFAMADRTPKHIPNPTPKHLTELPITSLYTKGIGAWKPVRLTRHASHIQCYLGFAVADEHCAALKTTVAHSFSVQSSDIELIQTVSKLPIPVIAEQPEVKNCLAVYSAKGGVGKSTVAVQIAHGLLAQGAKVGLLDLDIYGPNITTFIPKSNKGQPEVVQHGTKKNFLPHEVGGLKIMSISHILPPGKAAMWRGPMASSAAKQMIAQCQWGDLDYLILDLPPGTGDIQLTLAQSYPPTATVFVTTPALAATEDTRRSIELFTKLRIPLLGMVANMAYTLCHSCHEKSFPFGDASNYQKLAQAYNLPILQTLPLDIQLRECAQLPPAGVIRESVLQMCYQIATLLAQKLANQKMPSKPQIISESA